MLLAFLATFLMMATVMAIMAVGVMAGRAPIKGSCGGIGAIGIDQSCEICGGNPQRCEGETQDTDGDRPADVARTSFYDADKI